MDIVCEELCWRYTQIRALYRSKTAEILRICYVGLPQSPLEMRSVSVHLETDPLSQKSVTGNCQTLCKKTAVAGEILKMGVKIEQLIVSSCIRNNYRVSAISRPTVPVIVCIVARVICVLTRWSPYEQRDAASGDQALLRGRRSLGREVNATWRTNWRKVNLRAHQMNLLTRCYCCRVFAGSPVPLSVYAPIILRFSSFFYSPNM